MKTLFTFIMLALLLSACGQKGDLILSDDVPDGSINQQKSEVK